MTGDKSRRFYKSDTKGFTLVEAMIGIALTGLILGAIYSVFSSANKTYFTQDSVADTQQRARIGLDMMVRDIRMAGLDPMLAYIAGIEEATATKIRFTADKNMSGAIENEPGVNVSRERLTYEYDPNTLNLYHYEGADRGLLPLPVALLLIDNVVPAIDNVTRLPLPLLPFFTYRDADGVAIPTPVSASNLANIRTVDISITCLGKNWKQGANWNINDNRVIARTLQTRISCRNLGM
jgi:type IV pilus assembly protein PilW